MAEPSFLKTRYPAGAGDAAVKETVYDVCVGLVKIKFDG